MRQEKAAPLNFSKSAGGDRVLKELTPEQFGF